jgi:Uma2 family endonuclease
MAGASDPHNLICASTIASLYHQARGQQCSVRASDMRVKIEATGLHTYPDISVVCSESRFADDEFDTLLNPIVVLEILSPSTERYDRGKKFHHYQQLESLREYVLIAQDSPRIERFLRQDDGTWNLTDVSGMDGSLQLASIDAVLKLADVYQKVTFEADDDGRESG